MTPFNLPWKLLAEIIAAAFLFAVITFGIHQFLEHEREIGRNEIRAQVAKDRNEKLEAALSQSALYKQQLDQAIKHADELQKSLVAAGTAAASASVGLQHTIDSIRTGVPSATVEALRKTTDTLAILLGSCKDEYRAMGQAAQGHANDVQTLIDAWPK